MTSPLLSICIPTYNRKTKLAEILDCLVPQCLGKNVEIVVSDNASDDGTAEYCIRQAATHKFFSYCAQKKNMGFSNNLVSVLSKANGKYLWMLGDDEVLHSEAVVRLLDAINATDPSWLLCNFVKLESPNDAWPAGGHFFFDGGLRALTLDETLEAAGVWASFMSISIIKRERYCEWLERKEKFASDYVGFEIALFSGSKGKCYILSTPILARVKDALSKNRFNRLSTYLFDFFDPIDSLVKQGLVSPGVRISLAHEMLFSMAGYLLLKEKIKGGVMPKIKKCAHYHARVPIFWMIVFPLLLTPSWIVKYLIGLFRWFVPKNSNSIINKLIISLGISNKKI